VAVPAVVTSAHDFRFDCVVRVLGFVFCLPRGTTARSIVTRRVLSVKLVSRTTNWGVDMGTFGHEDGTVVTGIVSLVCGILQVCLGFYAKSTAATAIKKNDNDENAITKLAFSYFILVSGCSLLADSILFFGKPVYWNDSWMLWGAHYEPGYSLWGGLVAVTLVSRLYIVTSFFDINARINEAGGHYWFSFLSFAVGVGLFALASFYSSEDSNLLFIAVMHKIIRMRILVASVTAVLLWNFPGKLQLCAWSLSHAAIWTVALCNGNAAMCQLALFSTTLVVWCVHFDDKLCECGNTGPDVKPLTAPPAANPGQCCVQLCGAVVTSIVAVLAVAGVAVTFFSTEAVPALIYAPEGLENFDRTAATPAFIGERALAISAAATAFLGGIPAAIDFHVNIDGAASALFDADIGLPISIDRMGAELSSRRNLAAAWVQMGDGSAGTWLPPNESPRVVWKDGTGDDANLETSKDCWGVGVWDLQTYKDTMLKCNHDKTSAPLFLGAALATKPNIGLPVSSNFKRGTRKPQYIKAIDASFNQTWRAAVRSLTTDSAYDQGGHARATDFWCALHVNDGCQEDAAYRGRVSAVAEIMTKASTAALVSPLIATRFQTGTKSGRQRASASLRLRASEVQDSFYAATARNANAGSFGHRLQQYIDNKVEAWGEAAFDLIYSIILSWEASVGYRNVDCVLANAVGLLTIDNPDKDPCACTIDGKSGGATIGKDYWYPSPITGPGMTDARESACSDFWVDGTFTCYVNDPVLCSALNPGLTLTASKSYPPASSKSCDAGQEAADVAEWGGTPLETRMSELGRAYALVPVPSHRLNALTSAFLMRVAPTYSFPGKVHRPDVQTDCPFAGSGVLITNTNFKRMGARHAGDSGHAVDSWEAWELDETQWNVTTGEAHNLCETMSSGDIAGGALTCVLDESRQIAGVEWLHESPAWERGFTAFGYGAHRCPAERLVRKIVAELIAWRVAQIRRGGGGPPPSYDGAHCALGDRPASVGFTGI